MAFEITNGILKQYTAGTPETEITVPEGVTEIADGCFTSQLNSDPLYKIQKIILPASLKKIGADCFRKQVTFFGEYDGITLVLYGTEISLRRIFAENVRPDMTDDGMDWLVSHGWQEGDYLDDDKIKDAAWEYYQQEEEALTNGVIRDINEILSGTWKEFTYLRYPELSAIAQALPDKNAAAESAVNAAKEAYLKDFDIQGDVLVEYKGTSDVVIIPDGVKSIKENAFSGCKVSVVVCPESLNDLNGHLFVSVRDTSRGETSPLKEFYIKGKLFSLAGFSFCNCTELEIIGISDDIPRVWGFTDRELSRSERPWYALKAIRYEGKYGTCDIACSYKNLNKKMKELGSGLKMLADRDFAAEVPPATKQAVIMGYFAKTRDAAALSYITENLAKLMTKAAKEGNAAFVRAVLEADLLTDAKTVAKYSKAATSAGQTAVAALLSAPK